METYSSILMLAQAASDTATKAAQSIAAAVDPTVSYVITIIVAVAIVTSLFIIYLSVRKADKWSLSEALSEEVELNNGTAPAITTTTELKASSSRLIALLAGSAILLLYIGVGLAVLQKFIVSDSVSADLQKFVSYFWAGIVLFAPYLANKFSDIFSSLRPKA